MAVTPALLAALTGTLPTQASVVGELSECSLDSEEIINVRLETMTLNGAQSGCFKNRLVASVHSFSSLHLNHSHCP